MKTRVYLSQICGGWTRVFWLFASWEIYMINNEMKGASDTAELQRLVWLFSE